MSLKQTKTPIMGLAALLILLYHLLPLPRTQDAISQLIRFFVTTAYIGVDLFFFMSAYMAVYSDTSDYFGYVKRKFLRIYPLFLAFGLVALLLGGLRLESSLLTFLGLDLFLHGGGSLLWFIPALSFFYLAAPFYLRLMRRVGVWRAFVLGLSSWLGLMIVLEQVLSQHSANIFLCRIPIILLGFSLSKYEGRWSSKNKLLLGSLLFALGLMITWNFGYRDKLHFLISDLFYIAAIPHIMGTALLSDVLFSRFKSRVFAFTGRISLELYCVQMVLGPLFFEHAVSVIKQARLAFVLTLGLVFIASYLTKIFTEKSRLLCPRKPA